MSEDRSSGLLSELKLPLRDALRGANVFADLTTSTLKPVLPLLPETVRSRLPFSPAVGRPVGRHPAFSRLNPGLISDAAQFVSTTTTAQQKARSCAKAMVAAWDELNQTALLRRHLVSETIIVSHLSYASRHSNQQGVGKAAMLLKDLRESKAIGRVPGLARATTSAEQFEIDLRLVSIMVWLLAERAPTMREERELLNLSAVWVKALDDEAPSIDDTAKLTQFLALASERL